MYCVSITFMMKEELLRGQFSRSGYVEFTVTVLTALHVIVVTLCTLEVRKAIQPNPFQLLSRDSPIFIGIQDSEHRIDNKVGLFLMSVFVLKLKSAHVQMNRLFD